MMPFAFPVDLVTLLTFVPAALALNLTPGADMMLCVGQGLRGGPVAAAAASAGVALGGMVHVLLAGLGLGAMVAALPWMFEAIRWLGVAYLLWLAWQTLRRSGASQDPLSASSTQPPGTPSISQGVPALTSLRQGLLVNLSNPKVILFVLAFVPQFVDPARGAVLAQFLILGAIVALGGLVVNALAGIFAHRLGRRFARRGGGASLWLGRISAGIFAALALRLAFLQKG